MLGGTLGGATGCKDCSKHGGWVKKESSEKNKVSAHVAHEKPPVHWWVEDVHSASQKTGGKGIIRYSKKSRRTGEETRRTRASNLPFPSTVPLKKFVCQQQEYDCACHSWPKKTRPRAVFWGLFGLPSPHPPHLLVQCFVFVMEADMDSPFRGDSLVSRSPTRVLPAREGKEPLAIAVSSGSSLCLCACARLLTSVKVLMLVSHLSLSCHHVVMSPSSMFFPPDSRPSFCLPHVSRFALFILSAMVASSPPSSAPPVTCASISVSHACAHVVFFFCGSSLSVFRLAITH